MSAAAYRPLLATLMRDRAASHLLLRLTGFIALCIVGELLFGMRFGQPKFGPALVGLLVCGTAYMWCGAFLKSAVQQNQPAYACLVPKLRVRLMTLTALLFITCTLASAGVAALLLGHGGYALVGAGMLSVYILFANRYLMLNFLPSVMIIISVSNNNRPLRMLFDTTSTIGEPVVAGVGVVVLALLGVLGMHVVFPQGGDGHVAWHRHLGKQKARLSGATPASDASVGGRWTAWLRLAYTAALRGDSRGGASQGRMMMHALGSKVHDGGAVAYMLITTLAMVLAGRYLAGQGTPDALLVSSSVMQGCVLLASLMYAVSASANVARHGGEQGLYRLTPAAPSAPAINRVLAGTLLFRCLRLWLISLVCAACIDIATFGQLRGVTVMLATLMLPVTGLVLRNYAVMSARSGEMVAVVGTVLLVTACIAAVWSERMLPGFPWGWGAGGVTLVSAAGLYLRWRHLLSLPPLLPAGRLSRFAAPQP
jgi:hypothetical protein